MSASDANGSSYYSSATSSYPSWSNSLKYNNNNASKGGDNMNIGPEMVVGGIGSIVGGIGSAIGANAQAKAMQNIAGWQIQAEDRARFQSLLAGQNAMTYGKQFDMGLQRDAANYQQGFLDPRKSILGAEDLTRKAAVQLGPFGQQLRQQQNTDEINRTLAGKYSPLFGNISANPYNFGVMPGYTASSLV
jgi:hypothetical protein